MDEYLLQCNNLVKKYGECTALAGININIPPGRIIGLLGPNGSGKTTFMKLASGLINPTEGEILINGLMPCSATKSNIAYLPDKDFLQKSMTIKSLINMYADFFSDFRRSLADELLNSFDIPQSAVLKSLSFGSQEKVKLALTLSRNAQLYMLDEPARESDSLHLEYIVDMIYRCRNASSSVIISTHRISDFEKIFDDVIFIDKGQVVLCRQAAALRNEDHKSVDSYFKEVFQCL